MPVVINLLSSPVEAPAPRARAKSPAAGLQRAAPSRRLDYDVLDLTGDTPRHELQSRPSATSQAKRPAAAAVLSDDFLFFSDDFNTTGDLDGSPKNVVDDRATKKQRMTVNQKSIAESSVRTQQRSFSGVSKPIGNSTLQAAGSKRSNATRDDIEFTSSPHFGYDSRPLGQKSALTKSPRANKENVIKPAALSRVNLDSDPFASSPPLPPLPQVAPPKEPVAWDHISSSAPEASLRSDPFASSPRALNRSFSEVIDLEDSDSLPGSPGFSDDEFPDINDIKFKQPKPRSITSQARVQKLKKPSQTSKASNTMTAEEKSRDKAAKAAAREAEKKRKDQKKQLAREQKARDKVKAAALAEVNKIRTDKKTSTPEMIVDIPSSLNASTTLQIETLLQDLRVQCQPWSNPAANVIKWRRKVAARFNEELGHWEPIPLRIEPESHALVILTAAEFVELALGSEGSDIEAHVSRMRQDFSDHTLIYLVEGLTAWMRKNRNVRNRQFVSAVRNAGEEEPNAPPPSTQAATGRKRKNAAPQEYISEDSVEDALLNLQILHGVLIHHTNAAVETAQWVAVFTQHISTIPYRRQREQSNMESAGFCMETGQVRTGDGAKDTYVRMLQEIVRVTAPIAYGIAAEFDTVSNLVKGLEEDGPLRLEGVRKSANKDGAFSDRNIGQAVSRRIYKVFTGRDERSTDV